MDIRKLQRVIVDALEDVKAADIAVYNSTGLTQLFDRVIIASGTSNRQTKALAASVRDKVKAAGGQVVSVEGEDTGEWVLVDLGDAIVHVMQPAIRAYYNLEEIWGAKPVSLKSQAETDDADNRIVVAKKSAARKAAQDPLPVGKTAARKSPATNTVAKKTVAKKAIAKKAIAKKAVVEQAVARDASAAATRKNARKTVSSH
jgi:ribosome-associated protein